MMSADYIAQLADEAAEKAERNGKTPLVFESHHHVDRKFKSLPNLGSYRPIGFTLVEWPMVDKSGASNTGPAMGLTEMLAWIKSHLTDARRSGYAIVEEGQFQVVVGRFELTAAE